MGDSIRKPFCNNERFKRPNKRFGVNKGKSFNSIHIDQNVQEATPEHMRIEIDNIIKNFLDDHEKSEYIFPTDLNNLQRKYIHFKALRMNLSSKSYGKEPNRQLHLKKKPKRIASQICGVNVSPGIIEQLTTFQRKYDYLNQQPQTELLDKWNKKYINQQNLNLIVPKLPEVNADIKQTRQMLPIFNKREEVLNTIINNQVVIISSETGSGKTTQIPQYILENAAINNNPCKIICTQPRRISALSAAERVAYERGEEVGISVGYQIRLESKCGPQTNLLYCTVGVLLRNIMNSITYLQSVTHIIVDEIHERGQLSDFLLIFLKQNLPIFSNLKVIIMSATVDTIKFTDYFQTKAVFTIPGRLYPIRNYFLDEILGTIHFFTPQMRMAMNKLKQKQHMSSQLIGEQVGQLSTEDQLNFNSMLRDYMEFSLNYDYNIHYEEATADLLQLFISENVSVDQQHSEKGWTALMVACHLGDMNFASKLCAMGASLNICDHMGRNVFDYARAAEKNNILQMLEYVKHQGFSHETSGGIDTQNLMQLYDMTTPDDFLDYELIISVIKYIHVEGKDGAILIFLPGYDEIMQCNDYIENSDMNSNTYKVFFLHSSMDIKDQRGVFQKLPRQRKIVLSTNIAETSVTIPDVVYVIDIGKAKEKVYDSYNKLSSLQTQWISKACAKQREGRAGRVEPGCCFKLYSSQRYTYMSEEKVPEILRVSLEELCLSAKVIAGKTMKIYDFLSLAPDPPRVNSINASIENLQSLGALDKNEDLTKLGECLSHLTVEPRLGKMLIYSCIFRCLEPMLTIVAAMTQKDPFQLPPQANLKSAAAVKRSELINGVLSDHIIYLKVFNEWQEESLKNRSRQFCREYFISESVMRSVLEIRRQFTGQLRAIGFIGQKHSLDEYNINGFSWGLIKAIMVGAYFPNVAFPQKNGAFLGTKTEDKVTIHHSSACKDKKYRFWCFYDEMIKNRNNFMVRGVTFTSSLSISLLCGVDAAYTSSASVNIDNWLEFNFQSPVLVTFRSAVQNLLNETIINPLYSFEEYNQLVIETLRSIMDLEEQQSGLLQPIGIGMKPKLIRNYTSNQRNTYQKSRASLDTNWRDHREGKTPKRFVPRYTNNFPPTSNASRKINFNSSQYGRPSTASMPCNTNQVSASGRNSIQDTSYGKVPPCAEQFCIDSQQWLMNSQLHTDYLNDWTSLIQSSGHYPFQDYSLTAAELLLRGLKISNDDNTNISVMAEPAPEPSHRHNGLLNGNTGLLGRKICKKNHDIMLSKDLYGCNNNNDNNDWYGRYNYMKPSTILSDGHSLHETEMIKRKFEDYDDNPIFLLIKANEKRNIDIAQSCKKWVFSPQTEKKVLYYSSKGKRIYLIYYIKDMGMVMGIAEYLSMSIGQRNNKPTAILEWLFKSTVNKNKIRHLQNPYDFGKPISESLDGVVIQQGIAEELIRIFKETERKD